MEYIESPNQTAGRQGRDIDRIVCHWIVGTLEAADAVFKNDSSDVSAHYGIGGDEIHQYVKEENTAWHAGKWDMNIRSIGIEHEGGPDLPISDDTYRTSGRLIKEICARHGIPIDREHIIQHKEVVATQCPGTLDLDRLIMLATDEDIHQNCVSMDDYIALKAERDRKDEKLEDCREEFAEYQVKSDSAYSTLQKSLSLANENVTSQGIAVSQLQKEKTELKDELDEQKAINAALVEQNTELGEGFTECSKNLTDLKNKKKLWQYSWGEFLIAKFKGGA